jgi:hypothetical protein
MTSESPGKKGGTVCPSNWWMTVFRRSLIVTTLLFLALASFNVFTAIDHNPQGEHCRFVAKGEWYHLRLDGDPCRLTMENVYLFIVTYLVYAAPIQGPLLIVRAVMRRRIRMGRSPPVARFPYHPVFWPWCGFASITVVAMVLLLILFLTDGSQPIGICVPVPGDSGLLPLSSYRAGPSEYSCNPHPLFTPLLITYLAMFAFPAVAAGSFFVLRVFKRNR